MNNKVKRTALRLDEDMWIILEAVKQSKGMSHSKIIRTALEHYFNFLIDNDEDFVKQNKNNLGEGAVLS